MDGVQMLASLVAGVVCVPVLQLIKKWTGLKDVPMAWLSFIFSMIVAIGVCLLTGTVKAQELTPGLVFQASGVVFTTATLVYRSLKEKLNIKAE